MAYIFLDESGDLGFKKTSSKYFLFTIAVVRDPHTLERVVKKVWRPLRKRHKKLGELHAYHANDATRVRILRKLNEIPDLKILSVILNKQKVYIDLQNQKNYLYNYTANILLDMLHNNKIFPKNEPICLVVDKKDTKKIIRENFIDYLSVTMKKRRAGKFSLRLCASYEDKSLQAVDFISWAIFRKYERSDYRFYKLVESKILDEQILFP